MSGLRVSVAMCTYNGAAHLREQLQSMVDQTRRPDELVVCDDRSTDATPAILEEFAGRAPFPVRTEVNEKNLGSTKNFEKAISRCEGDVIALSDQDDVWLPHRLEATRSAFDAPEVGLAFGDAEIVDEELNRSGHRLWDCAMFSPDKRERFRQGRPMDVLLRHNVVTGACSAFRAAYRDLLLPIPPGWVHDGWAALLIAAVAEVRMIPEPLILYRQHASQQIGASKMTFWDMVRLARRIDWPTYCQREWRNFQAARQRLIETNHPLREDDMIERLDEKVRHAHARMLMHQGVLRRVPLALRELLAGRYARCSTHWRTLAVDLVM